MRSHLSYQNPARTSLFSQAKQQRQHNSAKSNKYMSIEHVGRTAKIGKWQRAMSTMIHRCASWHWLAVSRTHTHTLAQQSLCAALPNECCLFGQMQQIIIVIIKCFDRQRTAGRHDTTYHSLRPLWVSGIFIKWHTYVVRVRLRNYGYMGDAGRCPSSLTILWQWHRRRENNGRFELLTVLSVYTSYSYSHISCLTK